MIRQTTFGIALSTVVLASGFTTIPPIPGHSSVKRPTLNQAASKPHRRVVSSTFKNSELEKSVFEQINRYRDAQGLPRLRMNPKITQQARLHSRNMAR
ncbi:MAG: CAP domain-containing protein, partial [Calothrix sp. SM1_7_51]|nr:CAP domain-containing protein [Calothrix sp. SM1_7_51]